MSLATPTGVVTPLSVFRPTIVRQPAVTVPVTVYTTRWNIGGYRIRRVLDQARITHHDIDPQTSPDAKNTRQSLPGVGAVTFPVVYIDGEWLITPTPDTIQASLHRHGLLPDP